MEGVAIRLEDIKKLLSILYTQKEDFNKVEDNLMDWFDRIETRTTLESLLDDNFGLIRPKAVFEVDDDHFGRDAEGDSKYGSYDHEFQIKYLLFTNLKASTVYQSQKYLKQILEKETDYFLTKYNLTDKPKIKQLMRNITELIQQEEVQFPSIHQIIRNKNHELGNDLSVILFYLIRGDECLSQGRDSADKDKMRLQCLILYKNLQQTNLISNTRI